MQRKPLHALRMRPYVQLCLFCTFQLAKEAEHILRANMKLIAFQLQTTGTIYRSSGGYDSGVCEINARFATSSPYNLRPPPNPQHQCWKRPTQHFAKMGVNFADRVLSMSHHFSSTLIWGVRGSNAHQFMDGRLFRKRRNRNQGQHLPLVSLPRNLVRQARAIF